MLIHTYLDKKCLHITNACTYVFRLIFCTRQMLIHTYLDKRCLHMTNAYIYVFGPMFFAHNKTFASTTDVRARYVSNCCKRCICCNLFCDVSDSCCTTRNITKISDFFRSCDIPFLYVESADVNILYFSCAPSMCLASFFLATLPHYHSLMCQYYDDLFLSPHKVLYTPVRIIRFQIL